MLTHTPTLEELPFLKSICWQGHEPSIEQYSEAEILALYERNWRFRGVLADLSPIEIQFIQVIALAHQSWLINEIPGLDP